MNTIMGRNFVSCAVALYAGLSSVAALTPEGMISANRYGVATPNPTGVCFDFLDDNPL